MVLSIRVVHGSPMAVSESVRGREKARDFLKENKDILAEIEKKVREKGLLKGVTPKVLNSKRIPLSWLIN